MRPVRTVAGFVLLAALSIGGAACTSDDDSPERGNDPEAVERVLLLADLASAVQHERATASLQLIGASAVLPELESIGDARVRVDDLRDDVASEPELDGLYEDLTLLREAVDDAATAGVGLHQNEGSLFLYDGYGPLTTRVLDLQASRAAEVGDPDTRLGAELLATGLGQVELLNNLLTTVLERYVDPELPTDAEWISRVSAIRAALENGRSEVTDAAADGPYSDSASELNASLDTIGYLVEAEAVIEGEEIDPLSLLTSVVAPITDAWNPFVESLRGHLAPVAGGS